MLRITIEPTEQLTYVDGALVRLWAGMTDGGIECRVFVKLIAVRHDADDAAFAAELSSMPPPAEAIHPVSLRTLLAD